MDFPNDIATNVFRIDDIKDIEWAFYRRMDHDGAQTRDQPEDDHGFVDSDQLHIVECMLRECGKHVLLEQDNSGLWVFSLSKAEQEGIPQALRSRGLGCSKAGTLQAGGLNAAFSQSGPVKRPDGTSKTPRGPGETNTLAFGANARPTSQSMSQSVRNCQDNISDSRHDLVVTQLYTRIVTAISMSLCHPLVDHKHFLQVGSSTYLEARTLGDRIIEDLRLSWASATTSTLSLDVKWLPTETLLISYSRKPLRRLSQTSHLLAHSEKKLSRDTPLLLSPSGIIARFYGIEDVSKKDKLSHLEIDIETMVSSRLAQSGIVIPRDTQWLRVLVERTSCEDGRQLADHQGHHVITLWPAHLCFCEDAVTVVEDQEIGILTSSRNSGTMDALAIVETWYLGKAARTTALETRRQKHELEVQQVEVSHTSDDEDALSDPELEMSHYYNAPQDVSGIYPTPPDGIPTNPTYSSPNNNPLSAGLENEENRGATPGAICRPFDEQGNEDLFGEMDIDMFATNGLTEADFSFFDEPNDVEMEGEPNQLLAENDLEMKNIPNTVQEVTPARDRVSYSMPENEDGHLRLAMASEDELLRGEPDPDPAVRHATSTQETGTLDFQPEETHVAIGKEHKLSDNVDFDTKIVDVAHSIQRTSFDAVRFQGTSSAFDGKYAMRGRFGVDIIDPPTTSKPGEQIPNPEGLHPQLGIPRATESLSEDDIDIDFTNEELSESPRTTNDHDEAVADSKGNIQRRTPRKRKRDASEDLSNMATPASPASAAAKPVELHERTLAFPALELFSPRIVDQSRISLMKESKAASPCISVFVGNDSTFMGIAQMVLDQAVSGSSFFHDSFGRAPDQDFLARQEADNQIEKMVITLSSSCNKLSKRCTISDYAGLGEKDAASVNWEQIAPLQGQKTPRLPYPTKPPSMGAAQSLFKIQPPYTCVRRTGSSLDIAASSLRFWEELSLAPAHDGKNVTAFCIFPDDENARIHVATFLNMVKGAYQSCNLGSHELGADLPKYINGQVPLSMDEGAKLAPDLNDKCELLGRQLGKLGLRGGNTVIYIVDSSDPERSLPTLCEAFLNLFEAYNTALSEVVIDKPNDLVLQIVSSNLLFSPDSVPMPSPTDYRRLAFEVYDRCGPNQEDSHRKHPQYLSVPAIRLAKPIPKAIDLRLTPESYTPRLQCDNCIHIAYVWNPDDHWLTASWTDNQGILSWNACYCFGEEEETPWNSFADIIKEIWDTTLEMMNLGYPPWRLFICKQSPADRRELEAWQKVLVDSSNQQVSVTILTIDTDPPLDFPLQEHTNKHPDSSTGLLATPGNTPQSNAASPDISSFGTTPGGAGQVSTPPSSTALADHDAEARLVDVTNETWGVIISSTLQNLPLPDPTISNICPALACTYLIKRAGPRDEDGVLRIAVDLIHGQAGHRAVLKEVSAMYSGLALLARVRAMRDGEAAKHVESILPCHLIAARRGHIAVSATMRYGEG